MIQIRPLWSAEKTLSFISGDDADIPEDPDEAFRKNAMKLTRIRAVEQVKKMVALVDDIAETTIKNSVLGEEMRTKSPLGMQMIMTKLSGRNTVGKDTNGKFMGFFYPILLWIFFFLT